jgi:hypothetical protein
MASQKSLLVPFLARNAVLGVAIGWSLLALLLWYDIGLLGTLWWRAEERVAALCLMLGGFAVTFGSLAMGTAIFLLPRASASAIEVDQR